MLDATQIKEYTEMEIDIMLVPIKVGSTIQMKQVTFDANKWDIQASSYIELDRVAEFLLYNKNIYIEVSGHTNNLCDEVFCKELSQKRAMAIKQYLVSKGVASERIKSVGYGSTQPLVQNNSKENRKHNQRVAFKVLTINDQENAQEKAPKDE